MADWPLMTDGQRMASHSTAASSLAGSVSTPVTANTKSAWGQMIASTAFDASFLMFNVVRNTSNSGDDFLVDVAVGASGSEQIIVADMLVGTVRNQTGQLLLPVYIPASSRISVRAQCSAAAARTIQVQVLLFAGGFRGASPLSRVATYGANASVSGGVTIDPGAVANTDGAWTEVTSATSFDHEWLVLCVGGRVNSGSTSGGYLFDVAVGASGSEQEVLSDLAVQTNASGLFGPGYFPMPFRINAGSRVAVRSRSSVTDATDRLLDVVLLGAG